MPVILTSICCNVVKRFVHSSLLAHLVRNHYPNDVQYQTGLQYLTCSVQNMISPPAWHYESQTVSAHGILYIVQVGCNLPEGAFFEGMSGRPSLSAIVSFQ